MHNLSVILHQNVVGYSEVIKNDRTAYSILLTLAEEMGELATEISIHSGHSYKSHGSDGVMGEAIDVIAAVSDLSYILNRHDDVTTRLNDGILSSKTYSDASLSTLYAYMMILQGKIVDYYLIEDSIEYNHFDKNAMTNIIADLVFTASCIIESVCKDSNHSVTTMILKLEKWKMYYSLPEGYSIGTWEDDCKSGYIFYTDEHGIPPVEVYDTKKEAMKAAWEEYSYSQQ